MIMHCPKCGNHATHYDHEGQQWISCDECEWVIGDYEQKEQTMDPVTRCMWCGTDGATVHVSAGRPRPVVHWVACESCFERVVNGARPNERKQGGAVKKRGWFANWIVRKAHQIVVGGGQ